MNEQLLANQRYTNIVLDNYPFSVIRKSIKPENDPTEAKAKKYLSRKYRKFSIIFSWQQNY